MESTLSVGFAWDAKFGLLLVKQRRVFLNYIEYDSEKNHVPVHKHMKCRNHRFTMKEFVIREQSARMYVRGPLSQTIIFILSKSYIAKK